MNEPLAMAVTALGVAGALSVLFQTIKIVHLRESRDISLLTYVILFINALFWLMYGFSLGDLPLIITYIVATATTLSVIVAYFVYQKKEKGRRRHTS